MTDRYERIRAALADMDAAAEARNALAWRDAHARFVVHVAPDTIRALLAERDALARDAERLDALEALVKEQPDRALLLHHGFHIVRSGERFYSGIGLSNTRRSLRQAIDQARGKGGGEVGP